MHPDFASEENKKKGALKRVLRETKKGKGGRKDVALHVLMPAKAILAGWHWLMCRRHFG